MACISEAKNSCMKNGRNNLGTRRCILWHGAILVNNDRPQDTYILWIRFHYPCIWKHFIVVRTVHQSAFVASELTKMCWTAHMFYNYPPIHAWKIWIPMCLWQVIQIYVARLVEQYYNIIIYRNCERDKYIAKKNYLFCTTVTTRSFQN